MEGMIGEIRMFAGNFAPKNWSYCNGQITSISSNTALFSILGTTYGGNGTTTFALPNLQGRVPVGVGGNVALGQVGGTETTTLMPNQIPPHTHQITIKSNAGQGNQASPIGGFPSQPGFRVSAPGYTLQLATYGTANDTPMAPNALQVGISGSNLPISVLNPHIGMNWVICLYGIFPARG